MKQKLRVFLTLLLCAVASVGWGDDLNEINFTQSTSSIEFTNFSGAGSYNKEKPESFSVTGNDGNSYSWTKFYCMAGSSTNSLQMHVGDAYAISPTIKSSRGFTVNVTFNATAKGNLKLQIGEEDAVTGTGIGTTGTNNDVTITATTTSTETSFKLSNIKSGSNSAAVYVTKIEIVSTAEQTDPSITAENVDIDYNATSGVIEYSINNPDDNGELTAATTSDWLILGTVGTTVPFTCSANEAKSEREATVTLTYTYGDNQTVTKNVTVTQAGNPNAVDKISDITATGTYEVQGTIVAKSQRGFIVGDGTGYVYYYNQNYAQDDYNIGGMVKLSGSVVAYGGVFEFNNTATITAATKSNYVAEEPTVLTGAQMDSRVASTTPTQLSNYVQFEGTLSVSGTHYNITNIDGATTAKGSISYPINTDFTSLNGKTVKVTGYYVGVSSSTYYNIMLGSIEEVDAPPIIDANDVTLAYDAISGEIAYTVNNAVEGKSLSAATTADWISNISVGASSVTFTVTANEGTEDRSATFTLSYEGAENKIVTVTQKHHIDEFATLPFEFNGGKADIEDVAGLTQSGLGDDYGSAPKLKFDDTGEELVLKFNDRPGKLTFDIKGNSFSGSTFTVQTSENGIDYTNLQTYTELGSTQSESFNNLGENVRYIKWVYTNKSSGNVALGNIKLAEYSETPTTSDKYVKVTSTSDLTNGQYLIVYEEGSVAFDGSLEALDAASNTIDVTIANNEIAPTDVTAAAEFTIDVTAGTLKNASGYYIGQTNDANGMATSTSEAYTNTISIDGEGNATIVSSGGAYLRYNSTSGQTRFRYFKSSTYTAQKAIQLYKKVETTPETESVTVGSAGYTTYVTKNNVAIPEGVEVYIVTDINESSIHMKPVTGAIPANTPIVVKAFAATYELTATDGETADVSDNLLLGSDGKIKGDGSTIYALGVGKEGDAQGKVGFYRVKSGATVPAGKAYLNTSVVAKDFLNFDFGETDGIGQIEIGQTSNVGIYNLNGQKVNKAQKGIYIVNGKKVVIK